MKSQRVCQLVVALLVALCTAQGVQAITAFNQNPFHAPLSSESELRTMLLENQADVQAGLTKAGQPELFAPLIAQIGEVEIRTVEYAKGQKIQWMFYRKKGKGPVRVDKDVVWEGEAPFPAYEFYIDQDGQRYTFVIPHACGNLGLKDVQPVPVVVEAPPVEEPEKTMPLIVDVGYLHQLDPANYLFLRVGLEHPINDNLSLIGMLGIAPKVSGTDGDSAFIADVFANYTWPNTMFIGAGLGAWISTGDNDIDAEDSDLDLILNVGGVIYEKPDAFTTSLFVEVRSAVDELDDFDLYGRIGAGLRIRF